MMYSLFFRGESFFWFEYGGVEDVVIRNNNFIYCSYSGSVNVVVYITPRYGKSINQETIFERNIKFKTHASLYPNVSLFDFTNYKNI